MDIRVLALVFSAGATASHWLPWARPLWGYWLFGAALLLPARRLRIAALAALGLGWGAWHVTQAMNTAIDAACWDAEFTGRVVGLPTRTWDGPGGASVQRFWFAVDRPAPGSCVPTGAVRLTWLSGPELRGGEAWLLVARLKPPHANANRFGFDAGRWNMRNKVTASGYVVAGSRGPSGAPDLGARLDRIRDQLRDRLLALPLVKGDVLTALTLGDASAISREDMNLYRRTGTMHLLVISGLHVGVVTAFGFFVGRAVALVFGGRTKALGVAGGLLFSASYVLLAGAGLSLIRAFAMSTTGMLALVAGRSISASAVFSYALVVVLLVDPMAPLAPGFWLSFGAVAVLLGFFAPRTRRESWISSALTAQLAIALVFAPATIGITGLVHPLAIGANLLAVPVVTLIAVPLALAGTALVETFAGPWLLVGADFCIAVVGDILELADRIAPLYVSAPSGWLFWIGACVAVCLLPVSRLAKAALASAALVPVVWPLLVMAPRIPEGEVEVTVFDVGQGTSVLVETAGHALLYDTGPAFLAGADAGASVVVPGLRGLGRDTLDLLMLSHSDLDHVGGTRSVTANVHAGVVLAGEPVPGQSSGPCVAGMLWRWDGVRFAVVAPVMAQTTTGNNASCVLLIETRRARVLLAGDIEKEVEAGLELPPVDLLLVPHHGSATSSTEAFVAATRPAFAIVGAGWDNAFGHPHPAVVERYRDAGAHILSTAVSGALRWNSAEAGAVAVERCRESPYWRRRPAGPWRRPAALSRRLATCVPEAP